MLKRQAKRNPKPGKANKNKLGFGYEMPPDRQLVYIYFDQKGLSQQAHSFYEYYDDTAWCSPKGTRYRNWKVLASDWIFNYQQEQKLHNRQLANSYL